MIQTAMEENIEFRQSLPRLFHSFMGVMHQETVRVSQLSSVYSEISTFSMTG